MRLSKELLISGGVGERLVLAHGFTQNARCWGRFVDALAACNELAGVDCVAVDLPGHGRSHLDDVDLWCAGDLLVGAGGAGVYLGYSMGGRILLHAGLSQPESIKAMVLISATAGIDDPAQRQQRRQADEELAVRLECEELSSFLKSWLSQPLFASLDAEVDSFEQRLSNRSQGLAASLRRRGTGSQDPLWHRLESCQIPTLVLAGADDSKFVALGQRLETVMPKGRFVCLPGGHGLHLESPELVARAVAEFWAEHG